jgi:hypothetical protein
VARAEHAAVFDPSRQRLVLFGGVDGNSHRSDVWSLDLGPVPQWTQLLPVGAGPGPRSSSAAIYDPASDRMVVMGGFDGSIRRNDTWALTFGGAPQWVQLDPQGPSPPVRSDHTLTFIPTRNQAVLFGGFNTAYLHDAWMLDLNGALTWTPLTPDGVPPSGRAHHTAVYDAAGDRLVVFGGDSLSQARNDVWALTFGDNPAWVQLLPRAGPPSARNSHVAIYDPTGNRMIVSGGVGDDWRTWMLTWETTVAVPSSPAPGRLQWRAAPNPSRGVVQFIVTHAGQGPVSLRVYDVRGRRLRELRPVGTGGGRFDAAWDGRDFRGRRVSAGVYFCRLSVGSAGDTKRIVLLD